MKPDYPVIIVGGGPCGLLTSLLLARYGIRNVVVERHPDISIHPKAMGITRRTGELYRQLGLYERMRAADVTNEDYALSLWSRALTGELLGTVPVVNQAEEFTPCVRFHCPQPHTEAVLAREIHQHPLAEIRHYCEVQSVELRDDSVEVVYQDRDTEERHTVTGSYLIAADGARSPIRESLKIEAHGPGDMGYFLNTYFRANYGPYLEERRAILYQALGEDFFEFFVTVNGQDLWLMHHYLQPGESASDYTESRITELIKKASGLPEVSVEIISMLPWVMSPKIAAQWRRGRCFLVGDAAARLSPSGGLGMNTGLHGGHNLAWKLASVLHGIAGDGLLDTYDRERKPVAEFSSSNSNENYRELYGIVECAMTGQWEEARQRIAHSRRAGSMLGQDLGMFYTEGALVAEEAPPPSPADPINDYVPVGCPGARAPHLWLEQGGKQRSTLDLFGRGLVILTGSQGLAWASAAKDDAWPQHECIPTTCHTINGEMGNTDGKFEALYGIDPDGVVLVRPDGYIGARIRSLSTSEPADLVNAARSVMGL